MTPLLSVENLRVTYRSPGQVVEAVRGISFEVAEGEVVGMVGESGCGKSSTANALARLVDFEADRLELAGEQVARVKGSALARYRKALQVVFQDPMGALNPRLSIGFALQEVVRVHRRLSRDAASAVVAELLVQVGLDASFMSRYSHEISGGQRQRIGIARALAVEPRLLICDEPVSALDVSVQAQILNLLREIHRTRKLTMLFIAHDLAVVRYMCSRVLVMLDGEIVEAGETEQVLHDPQHPYTKRLLAAVPAIG